MRSEASAPQLTTHIGPAFGCLALALDARSDVARLERTGEGILKVTAPDSSRARLAAEAARLGLGDADGVWVLTLDASAAEDALGATTPALVAAWRAARSARGEDASVDDAVATLGALMQRSGGLPDPAGIAACAGDGAGWAIDLHPPRALSLRPALAWIALCTPEVTWGPRRRRDASPREVAWMKHARQMARAGALGHLLCQPDASADSLRAAFEDAVSDGFDALFPGMHPALRGARRAGALGSWMSGTGPTLCAYARGESEASAAADAMIDALEAHCVLAQARVVRVGISEERSEA